MVASGFQMGSDDSGNDFLLSTCRGSSVYEARQVGG